ncbi:MAG: hypothetical protein H6529_03310 [Nocardioides sp.]|nr:hypothetical protein [Nocardioidaceae bacterium]MCB8955488.1 hypothetical protein [Nocardioides sp.]
MIRTRTTAAAVFSAFAFSALALTAVPAAQADDAPADSCSSQQAQLDRAQAKYDALQEKFAEHPTQKNKKAKKAQAQRVAHAQARLDKCEAASA